MVPDVAWLEPDERLVFRSFALATRRLFLEFDRELQAEAGLSRTHFEILWLLAEAPSGAMRMSDLADAASLQPSRITHAVSRLEEVGQVRRELCAEDRRGWYAVLTEQGREVLSTAAPRYAEIVRRHFLAPLEDSQRAQLTAICTLLIDGLQTSAVGVSGSREEAATGASVTS